MSETKLFSNLSVQLNLGDFEFRSHIGRASAFKNDQTGETRIEIDLRADASEALGNLVEVFNLKAIGFAGIAKPGKVNPANTFEPQEDK